MCKAWSGIITKHKKVYWKMGVDSHDNLRDLFKKDKDLEDKKDPPHNTFARVEVSPKNGNYVNPDKWIFFLDERVKPKWWNEKLEKLAWKGQKKWWKDLNEIVDMKGLGKIKNPLTEIKPPKAITKKHLQLVKKIIAVGESVRESVRASVWESVGASIGASVRESVWASVWESVWSSVRASVGESVGESVWSSAGESVWSNIGIHFKGIKKWKYTENLKVKGYPFLNEVKLWKMGLVLSFYETKYRLHGGPKAKIMWEGTKIEVLTDYIKK